MSSYLWDTALVAHHEAAVDVEGLPGHVIGVGAGQKRHHAGKVLGSLGAAERDPADPPFPGLALAEPFERAPLAVDLLPHRRLHRAWADAVRRDPVPSERLRR